MAEKEVEVNDTPAESQPETPKQDEQAPEEAVTEPQQEEQTMRAVILSGHGGYSKLKIEKRPKPTPSEGHVLIKVQACGQNFIDLLHRQGMMQKLPKAPSSVLGIECSGVVEEIGQNVTEFEVGSKVCCISMTGAFAEYVSVPSNYCYAIPESMSFEEAAALPINYLTAYFLLFQCGNVSRRKNVLVHCAAGGVGMAATQLCKTVEGVTIIGTASSSKHEAITKNGVDHAIDYRSEDFVEASKKITDSVDLILDPLGGGETKKCYDLLCSNGALVIYGYSSQIAESKGLFSGFKSWFSGLAFSPLKLLHESKTVSGFAIDDVKPEVLQETMKILMKLYEDGSIKPCIDTVFALEEVANAHQRMHDRANIGKIVLSPLKEPSPDNEPVKKRKRSFSKFHSEKPKVDKRSKEEPQEENGKQTEVDKEEKNEAAKGENKEEQKTTEDTKEDEKKTEEAKVTKEENTSEKAKEDTKEEEKTSEEVKEETKEENKTSEEVKEETKDEKKTSEEVKEETKEENKTSEEVKEETKDEKKTSEEVKEETKEEEKASEEVKEETKEEEKTSEEVKEETKDDSKDEAKEEPKDETKEEVKDDSPKETRDDLKEESKEDEKSAEPEKEETKEEIKEETNVEEKVEGEEEKEEGKEEAKVEEKTEENKSEEETTEQADSKPENGEQTTEM